MMKKTTFLISALCMLILANVLMMSYASPAFRPTAEGFAASMNNESFIARKRLPCGKERNALNKCATCTNLKKQMYNNKCGVNKNKEVCINLRKEWNNKKCNHKREGFSNYSPAAAKDSYEPMGAFDNIKLSTGNTSSWRSTSPDEPLQGNYPKFEVGPDNLFMFKDNQCKPSCCGASYACDGGCVCTTPEQRNFINMRGGNRTAPDAGV